MAWTGGSIAAACADAFKRVVRVDQERRCVREDPGEGRERLGLGRERLDPGMGHRARRRGCPADRAASTWLVPAKPGEVRGPGREEPGVGPVSAPGTEIVDRPPPGRLDDPRRLRRDQGRIAERRRAGTSRPTAPAAEAPRLAAAARPGRRPSPRGPPRRRPRTGASGSCVEELRVDARRTRGSGGCASTCSRRERQAQQVADRLLQPREDQVGAAGGQPAGRRARTWPARGPCPRRSSRPSS